MFTYKQENTASQALVFDNLAPAFVLGAGAVLRLPVEVLSVDKVVMILVIAGFSLLVQRHK